MARRVLHCCTAALFLHLTCVAAVQMLNNINDLKRIQFGQSVPRHSLQLLHWFANEVDVSYNRVRLNFNPNYHYGSHHYANSDGLLPYHHAGYRYYTVGNLNEEGAAALPDYVRHQQYYDDGYNRARIIFRASGQTINQVYLTQHYPNSLDSSYDPDHTYRISTDLLRELRWFERNDLRQFYTHGYIQLQSLQHQPAHNVADSICDTVTSVVKWVFLIVMIAVLTIVIALNTKPPHRY